MDETTGQSSDGTSGRVAVWRSGMLAGSETFIRNQIDFQANWRTLGVGAKKLQSPLSRETDRIIYSNRSSDVWLRRLFFITNYSRRLERVLKEASVDILHAHFLTEGLRMLRTSRRTGIPLVVTAHGYDVTTRRLVENKKYRRDIGDLFGHVAKIVAVSEYVKGKLLKLGCPSEKIAVIPLGIPIQNRLAAGDEATAPRYDVVFVGRLIEAKGISDLLQAVSKTREPRKMRIAVVGDGPERDKVARLARELSLSVELFGHLDPVSVTEVLHNSRVFVGPSRQGIDGWREAFGLVFLEAALAGLPVVAYKSGGVIEAVAHGKTGLLAEEGDISQLADYIDLLTSNLEFAAQLGGSGFERVVREFDCIVRKRQLESLYTELVD